MFKFNNKTFEEIAAAAGLIARTLEQKEKAAMVLEICKTFKSLSPAAQFAVIEHFQNKYPEVAQALTGLMNEAAESDRKIRKWRKRRR